MLTFLEVNGVHMVCSDEDIVDLGLKTASGEYGYDDVFEWILKQNIQLIDKCWFVYFVFDV